MELIATSDQQLRHLGYHDSDLAPIGSEEFTLASVSESMERRDGSV